MFSKAPDEGSDDQEAPPWIFEDRASGNTNKPENLSSDPAQSAKCEKCEKCKDQGDKERSDIWMWLGPAALGLLGTIVVGGAGIAAAKLQRNVVIQTDRYRNSLSSSDNTPEKSNTDTIYLEGYE